MIFLATEFGGCVLHVRLDLTAAFDIVDHIIILSRLAQDHGIRDTPMD